VRDSRDTCGSVTVHAASSAGEAVDPIALEPVDEVEILTLVDNVYDALLTSDERVRRAGFGAGAVTARQFEEDRTFAGMIAEHGSLRWSGCTGPAARTRCCSTRA